MHIYINKLCIFYHIYGTYARQEVDEIHYTKGNERRIYAQTKDDERRHAIDKNVKRKLLTFTHNITNDINREATPSLSRDAPLVMFAL